MRKPSGISDCANIHANQAADSRECINNINDINVDTTSHDIDAATHNVISTNAIFNGAQNIHLGVVAVVSVRNLLRFSRYYPELIM